jgi:hypothetical protein
MSNKFKVLLLSFLLVCTGGYCGNLHVFYEQNGDCFVLVGNGSHRGVYALNNLTTDNYNYMYDPEDAYGISAGQWWTGSANETSPNFIEKRLYTFWASKDSKRSLDGVEVKRRVIPRGDSGVYGYDPPYIVHRAHSGPRSSPTGLGNHTYTDYCQSLSRFFTPSDIPCTEVPVSAGKDKQGYDLYWVTSGIDWYHARDYNVYSNWTYGSGGWCHRVVKEFLTEHTKDINLLSMNIKNKQSPVKVNSESAFVATVTTGTEGTASTLGECVDGCIRAQPDVALPGTPEPIVRFVYSSQVKRSYLYNRPLGETNYTLNNGAGDIIVGKGDNLTCNFIGISTRNSTSNYVYLLGSDVINEWMTAANCPASMLIDSQDDLACVAVSDQWWQTGGIVYAYDSKKAKVYSFVRVEGGKSGPPDEIDVHFDGRLPDKIGADGFGNLYVLKTELDPASTSRFGQDGTETTKKYIFTYGTEKHFVAIYRQMVYKAIYKRPYGLDTNFSRINNRIPLGYNEYEREYITEDNNINSKKIWTSNLYQTRYDGDGSNIRTELAVINVPTPPEPNNVDAVADCWGPCDLTATGFASASPDLDDGSYSSTRNIFFIAENAPYYDANGINITGSTEDKDRDGAVGCYPNTIKESSVIYHWKIVKTKDQFGKTINPGDKDYEILDTTGDYLLVFPSLLEGEFDVGLKVEYRYYDYTKLKVGALASEKETCLYPRPSDPPKIAAAKGRIVRDGYSWEHIKQTWKKPPESLDGNGIIMSSLNYDDDNGFKPSPSSKDKNLKKTQFVMDGASLCRQVDKNKNISYKGNNRWGLKLRETQANLDKGLDRTKIVMADNPPNPNDPNMVPDTLKWVDNFQVAWRSDLKRGNETIWTKTLTLENFNLTQEQLRELMPMPSDPLRYVINASVYRQYMYMVYVRYPVRQTSYGWEYKTERVPVVVTVSIDGEAEICVTDNTGPSIYQYNAEENASERVVPGYKMVYANGPAFKTVKDKTDIKNINENKGIVFINASTGETIERWNPSTWMIFYVCDNNPMSSYTGSKPNIIPDEYHSGERSNLKSSFNDKQRKAILHYDTANGIKRTASLIGADITPEPVENEAELKAVGLVPSKALSYVKYYIPAGCMDNFSNIEKINNARLPFNYANNTSGYTNYKFGLSWIESCNYDNKADVSWTNCLNNESEVIGSDKEDYFVGTIVIKDNDRPNIFINAFQDRYPDMEKQFRVPSIIVDAKYDNLFETDPKTGFVPTKNTDKWFLTVDDESNGPDKWYVAGTFGGDIAKSFTFLGATNAYLTIFRDQMTDEKTNKTQDCRLLTDVPVLFRYVMIDNSGTPKCTSFVLKDYDNNVQLADGKDDEAIQYIFRNAGRYYVELQVEDDAKDWPDNTNAVKNPTNATAAPQTRALRAYFEVLDSKFKYRVLERGINE